jgi:hypothetical protein
VADSWVRVVRSDGQGIGDQVFIDGDYEDVAGLINTAFETDTGQHTFETVDAAERPIWQATQVIGRPAGNSEQQPVIVVLTPA